MVWSQVVNNATYPSITTVVPIPTHDGIASDGGVGLDRMIAGADPANERWIFQPFLRAHFAQKR